MASRPANHHPKCTCRLCQPPVAEVLRDARSSAAPAQRPLAGVAPATTAAARRPAMAPPAPPPPPPPPAAWGGTLPDVDRDSATRATIANAERLLEASARAGRDTRMRRYLALRAAGIPRAEAIARVDAEFAAPAEERTAR